MIKRYTFLIALITALQLSIVLSVLAEQRGIINCDVQAGSCIKENSGGTQIEFDIQPKPVISMTELTFIVILRLNGKPLTDASVFLDLSMPGMYMGKNQPLLKQTGIGRYEGTGIITRCISNKKIWQAEVTILRNSEKEIFDFVFEVK